MAQLNIPDTSVTTPIKIKPISEKSEDYSYQDLIYIKDAKFVFIHPDTKEELIIEDTPEMIRFVFDRLKLL